MRGRVDFWIDIFAKYGKHDSVIHHRNFPQVVFKVLRMGDAGNALSEANFAVYKKREVAKAEAEITSALNHLASGKSPRNVMEQQIVSKMHFLPGGNAKYAEVVKDKLIRSQTGIKERYAEAISRSGRYLHLIEKIFVKDHGLPIELTRLPFVESSFDYKAYSSVGAAGIWQFMPRTGKLYMNINSYVDERRDIISATHGAAKYLKSAYKSLGTWPLALTSYNHGVYGVSQKVKQIGTKDIVKIVEHPHQRVFGFASTNFYPEFLASLDIYDYKEKFFPHIKPESPLRIYSKKLDYATSVSYIARKGKIPISELERTNYALTNNVWRGVYKVPKGYELKVPIQYAANLKALKFPEPSYNASSSIYGGAVYQVRSGDTLSKIAQKYKTTISKIKQLNKLKGDRVFVGQRLVVKEKEEVASIAVVTPKATHKAKGEYTVRAGDNLSAIAKKEGISVATLKALNNLKSNTIHVGQVLKLSRPSASSSKSSSGVKWHKIKKGESLWSIAKSHGVTLDQLKKLNGIGDKAIRAGELIKIP
ncbi:MAG: LysM peptidoglycan-binding domain-containing protein [Bdellovibrionota bacterium]